ncbi:hypothetical protein MMC25_006437 [Agyrium rufum]|nr:hypothetical protein [Agyrium rufum]
MSPSRIETANAWDISTMKEKCGFNQNDKPSFVVPTSQLPYAIQFENTTTIKKPDLDACFDLIAQSSKEDYTASSVRWSPSKKRKEMRLPDLRYVLVKKDHNLKPEAFLSFMLTYEDGHEVIYCYEIHLMSSLQRTGLGKHLMGVMEDAGRRVGVEKAMLTVFISNQNAIAFYNHLGYGVDPFSPEPRTLRNGMVKEPDYVILSKPLG